MVALKRDSQGHRSLLGDSPESFGELVEPFRRELIVHCYRMLGSIDDAEDAVQDALVRAWHGRHTFQVSISLKAWLYRIATNACLDAIARRKRTRTSEDSLGVGPYPDSLLGEATAGPEARYEARESISLAFLRVLQVLPPRQRAVLILRDVLSWRAAETAALLEVSVPAANSALQRARATVGFQYGRPGRSAQEGSPYESGSLRSLLERYVRVWEAADISGLVALLREDAVLSMPPKGSVSGSSAIGAFLAASIFADREVMRLVAARANRGPAFVAFAAAGNDEPLRSFAVLVLETDEGKVVRIDAFADPRLLARFPAFVA
jgi:RNA polymerase sigma-70 factor, ECF subfamily